MSSSHKSESVIEYTEKEEQLNHQVEKLDIVPGEAECVSEDSTCRWCVLLAQTPSSVRYC